MNEIRIVGTILINGVVSTDAELNKDVMESRSTMCDLVNNGWIDKYNKLTDEISVNSVDIYGYQEAYQMLTNGCWTKILNEKRPNLRIIEEVLIPNKDYYNLIIKLITV